MYYGSNEKLEVGACYDAGKDGEFVIFENVQQCIKLLIGIVQSNIIFMK